MITARTQDRVTILDLPDRVDSDKLRAELQALLAKGNAQVAVNLANIGFIESSGLGALVSAYKIVDDGGGRIVFFNIQPYVEKLVQVTRLDKVLQIAGTEAEALTRLQTP